MPRLLARLLAGSLLLLSWITTVGNQPVTMPTTALDHKLLLTCLCFPLSMMQADAASRHAVISGTDVDLLPGEALISLKKQV